jgi:hypothetical protein
LRRAADLDYDQGRRRLLAGDSGVVDAVGDDAGEGGGDMRGAAVTKYSPVATGARRSRISGGAPRHRFVMQRITNASMRSLLRRTQRSTGSASRHRRHAFVNLLRHRDSHHR